MRLGIAHVTDDEPLEQLWVVLEDVVVARNLQRAGNQWPSIVRAFNEQARRLCTDSLANVKGMDPIGRPPSLDK